MPEKKKKKIQNVEELRQRVEEEWGGLNQRVIDTAIREWHKRLQV